MPTAFDLDRFGVVGAISVIAAALVANIAYGLVAIGAALGAVAFVLWLRNRDSLRRLDEMLHEQAHNGIIVLEKAAMDSDGR